MRRFVALHRALDACPFHRDRAAMLADYLASRPSEDAGWALYLLGGGSLPRVLASAQLQAWLLEETALPAWLVEECRAQVGDAAETISLLAELLHDPGANAPEGPRSDPTLLGASLHDWATGIIPRLAALPTEAQRREILLWWRSLPAPEATFVQQLLTSRYQPPVPRRTIEEAIAAAFRFRREEISERIERLGLDPLRSPGGIRGWLGLPGGSPAQGELELPFAAPGPDPAPVRSLGPAAQAAPPLPPAAEIFEDAPTALGEPDAWLACATHGGPRAFLVREQGRAQLWAETTAGQGLECVSARFPELVQAAACLPDGAAVEGELAPPRAARARLAASAGRARTRGGLKGAARPDPGAEAVVFRALDLAWHDSKDMRTCSGETRLRRLVDLLPAASPYLRAPEILEPRSWDEARHAREALRMQGENGWLLVARATPPEGAGGPGQSPRASRLRWLSPPLTIDAVLLYVETGHAGLSGCNFAVWDETELVPLGRIPSPSDALNETEIAELERWARENEIERFGPVRSVRPALVFEIAFDEVEASPRHRAGLTLRAPRILRWKKGIDPSAAARIEKLRQLSLPKRIAR